MTEKQLIVIIILIGIILLITPVSAKIVTAKVDDKELGTYGKEFPFYVGTLHTEYGTIAVSDEDYNKIEINDTIRYDTQMINNFWTHYWTVEVVK